MSASRASRDLLARASGDPFVVLAEGHEHLAGSLDPDSASVVYRAMSIAARNAATTEDSIRFARLGAEVASDPSLRRECLLTMAGSMAESGEIDAALRVLDEASVGAGGLVAGQIDFQRGSIVARAGDYEVALAAFKRAAPVFRSHHRPDFEAMVLHNEGRIYTQTGRLAEAEAALVGAREIEAKEGRHMEVAGTDHNLGLLASYRGDIPEALRRLTESDETYMRQSGDDVPRHVSRCEVLLSAGLYAEALDLAKRIATGARAKGRGEDAADALMVAARAALYAGDSEQAVRLGMAAARQFERQGREVWVIHSNLIVIEARYVSEGASPEIRSAAGSIAAALERAGFTIPAARARLILGRIHIDLGDLAAADAAIASTPLRRTGPVELRLQWWHGQAMLRHARDDGRGADAAARAGLALLDEYQAGLGASDLRFAVERQGADLGEIGLRLATSSGRPRRIFSWMERTRARALRLRPVTPADDDEDETILSELRKLTADLRDPVTRADEDLHRRRDRLQEELRQRSRSRRGAGDRFALSLGDLADSLGSQTLVELGVSDGILHAVVVAGGRFRHVELGPYQDVEQELRRLRFDLRRVARMRRDSDKVRGGIERFDAMVLRRLGLKPGPVILVPPGPLMAAPWAVLPSLLGSTVTVSPSAELWLRSRAEAVSDGRVVLVAGPDLENAVAEVEALRKVHGKATVIGPNEGATALTSAIPGAAVAHAACHASFEVDNPMFSSLRLGDGDFNVYDIERLHEPPRLVVLSACDSGYTDTRAGDELTGLTSALLSMGSQSVVASVGLVPDSHATADLMLRFHRNLESHRPAEALSMAQQDSLDDPADYVAAASFLCIGGG